MSWIFCFFERNTAVQPILSLSFNLLWHADVIFMRASIEHSLRPYWKVYVELFYRLSFLVIGSRHLKTTQDDLKYKNEWPAIEYVILHSLRPYSAHARKVYFLTIGTQYHAVSSLMYYIEVWARYSAIRTDCLCQVTFVTIWNRPVPQPCLIAG